MSVDVPMDAQMLGLVNILYNSSNGNLSSGNSTYANSTSANATQGNSTHTNATYVNSTSANSIETTTPETYTKPSVTQNIVIQFVHPDDVDKTDEGNDKPDLKPPTIENSVSVLAPFFVCIISVFFTIL